MGSTESSPHTPDKTYSHNSNTTGNNNNNHNSTSQSQQLSSSGIGLEKSQQQLLSSGSIHKPSSPTSPLGSSKMDSSRGRGTAAAAAATTAPPQLGWVERTEAKVNASNTVPPGMTTRPSVPEGVITPGAEPCVHPPMSATGMNMFLAMRKEWLVRTQRVAAVPAAMEMDPDDVMDAIEETPGYVLTPPVHLPTMLEILIDVWEDGGLYD